MPIKYNQVANGSQQVHFSKAMFGEVESSRMTARPFHLTTFNAGELVPIYCREVLPDESLSVSMDFVIRQTTLLTPTMGSMKVDFYAFFVPNRIVNRSWKAVQGENYNGSWTANPVSLAPLRTAEQTSAVQIPVGSVADYYGFPTQQPIPNSLLTKMNDLKFRGYVMIWNEHFRDQNYQPPIPISYLNVYQGFLDSESRNIGLSGGTSVTTVQAQEAADGSFGAGAVAYELYGSGKPTAAFSVSPKRPLNSFKATNPPLRANKLHDYFTSVLPQPQKSNPVFTPISGQIDGGLPVVTSATDVVSGVQRALRVKNTNGGTLNGNTPVYLSTQTGASNPVSVREGSAEFGSNTDIYPSNLIVADNAEVTGLEFSINDLRMASAIQQVYEVLASGGSRYRSLLSSFFGLSVDDPFSDIPVCLGHMSRDLELYQTAQTSGSATGGTPQGNLAAFGYTNSSGKLFEHRFIEHGYLHIFAVVRHRNLYASYLARDNFRLNMLDFFVPQLANISNQPLYVREINPFATDPDAAFGYQEAWAEYRFEPDMVSGHMRPGVDGSLALWNYADDFDSGLQIADGEWLRSNSKEVLDRTLAVTSTNAPQFKAQFNFIVDKTLPMPTYSVPGMDII